MESRDVLVLAFDIERSGPCRTHDTIAIGASVLDSSFLERATLLLKGYNKETVVFDARCWREFWCTKANVLEHLAYKGGKTKREREREMIEEFHTFRITWENIAALEGCRLVLASDNPVFDGGYINDLMAKHMPYGTLPIPYTASRPQQYTHLVSVDDVRDGMSMLMKKTILDTYNIPVKAKLHTHTPDCDAYSIAHDLQVAYGIKNGMVTRK
jgi:hypothetical protein